MFHCQNGLCSSSYNWIETLSLQLETIAEAKIWQQSVMPKRKGGRESDALFLAHVNMSEQEQS